MLSDPHVVYICLIRNCILKQDRPVPEPEIVNSAITFRNTKKGFAVSTFYPCHQTIFSVQKYGSGIHDRINWQALQKQWIRCGIQVIAPCKRNMISCKHWIAVSGKDTVVIVSNKIWFGQQPVLFFFFDIILVAEFHYNIPPIYS